MLDVDYHVFSGTRAANQQVSRRRRFERLGIVLHRPGNQPALAGMANSGPARPANRDVAGFREVQQALDVPMAGVITDGQWSIRAAVVQALPEVPHQLCPCHSLHEAAKSISEADRHAK